MEAIVIKVIDSYTVVINKGSNHGITERDKFVIYEENQEIVDPETGENLGKLQLTKGTASIQTIQEKMSVLVSDKYRRISRTVKSPMSYSFGPVETYEESEMMPFDRTVNIKDIARIINRKE